MIRVEKVGGLRRWGRDGMVRSRRDAKESGWQMWTFKHWTFGSLNPHFCNKSEVFRLLVKDVQE